MEVTIREYCDDDLKTMLEIWNDIIEEGIAFPAMNPLSYEEGKEFFAAQSFTGVAEYDGEIVGLYILHPNNVGRCAHLCNTSYGVKKNVRGMNIGEKLVNHSMIKGRELGFKILQFNAVVRTNYAAIHLYETMGFTRLGIIPSGFLMKDGYYEDIILFYHEL